MCERCEKIDEDIARYRRLQRLKPKDGMVQDAANSLVAELQIERAALHSTHH